MYGFQPDCYNYLVDKYGVQLIISAQYATANNYSSLQLVAHRLGDSLVIDGDTYIRRPVVPLVRPGVSQFICQQTQQGHEWELITDADDRVVSVRKDSPSGYCMSGVSYWTEEAAALIREELDRSGPDDYWEDSVIRILDRVPVYATRVKMLLCEIDSLSDALSLGLLTPDELADQCSETQMAEKLKGLTNDTYHIQLDGKGLVLRIPGQGTDQIIDRSVEAAMLEMVKDLDITPECHFYAGGIKTTDFLEGYRILNHDTLDRFEVRGVVDIMRRLHDIRKRMNYCPLGSGALAGTTYPLDRQFTAEKLGFAAPCANSLDGVSDRDFCIELANAISICMMHLSRLSEEIILWCSWEFKFIELDDAFTTGSSIMPQKKNPDVTELIRGKTGRVYGDLNTLLVMMKGIPLAYNKDMQEDKEAIFDAVDTLELCLKTVTPMLDTMKTLPANMRRAAAKGFINATDCADYLTKKGMPFRDAYKLTGCMVSDCISKDKTLEELTLDEFKGYSALFENDIYDAIDLIKCCEGRTSYGGPSEASVKKQIELASAQLGAWEAANA